MKRGRNNSAELCRSLMNDYRNSLMVLTTIYGRREKWIFPSFVVTNGKCICLLSHLQAFSKRYCYCNAEFASSFHNLDTIFILSFAVIMLTTDLHNPNVKPERKMKLPDFIKNLNGKESGQRGWVRMGEGHAWEGWRRVKRLTGVIGVYEMWEEERKLSGGSESNRNYLMRG